MSNAQQTPNGSTAWVDHIPVLWFEPQVHRPKRQLILFLHHLGGTKESTVPFLRILRPKDLSPSASTPGSMDRGGRAAGRDVQTGLWKLQAPHVAHSGTYRVHSASPK